MLCTSNFTEKLSQIRCKFSLYLLLGFTLIASTSACEKKRSQRDTNQDVLLDLSLSSLVDMDRRPERRDLSVDHEPTQPMDMMATPVDQVDEGYDAQVGDAQISDAMTEMLEPFEPRPVEAEVNMPTNVVRHLPTKDGQPVVADNGQLFLTVESGSNSPLAGLARCVYWLQSCLRSDDASLDDCTLSAPLCQTQPSWQQTDLCCPPSCFEAYAALRMTGVSSNDALMSVYFKQMTCFPELRMELGR